MGAMVVVEDVVLDDVVEMGVVEVLDVVVELDDVLDDEVVEVDEVAATIVCANSVILLRKKFVLVL